MLRRCCKVLAVLICSALLCNCPISAQAAESDTIVVKVTVTPSLSVNITEDNIQLGSITAGSTKVSAAGITVTNNGSGANETYSLSLTNPAGWTASQSAAAAETYLLSAAFDADGTGITWNQGNHALSIAPVVCTASKFSADQTGVNVPYNEARKLWLQFKAPTSTTVKTEQNIVITVTAQAS